MISKDCKNSDINKFCYCTCAQLGSFKILELVFPVKDRRTFCFSWEISALLDSIFKNIHNVVFDQSSHGGRSGSQ
jgi:hypothetical protein